MLSRSRQFATAFLIPDWLGFVWALILSVVGIVCNPKSVSLDLVEVLGMNLCHVSEHAACSLTRAYRRLRQSCRTGKDEK
jgi:hypothetical protein